MKKYLFLVLILLPVILLGQAGYGEISIPGDPMWEEETETTEGTHWGMGGEIGRASCRERV